jgi:glycosyltransferase involved in cell wall biosynthesis
LVTPLLDCAPAVTGGLARLRACKFSPPKSGIFLPSLSVIVITKNEAHNIAECLASVAFANECVVVDSGSDDATIAIARAQGASVVVESDWQGFGAQKNRALAHATCDWVLSLDADERVSPKLHTEILAVLAAPAFAAYTLPRRSSFCGQFMQHSGWYPDRVTRLFKRGEAHFSNDLVHERLLVKTGMPVGKLATPLLHESYRNLEDVLNKANTYSTAGAVSLRIKGKNASLATALGHGLWAFFRTYFLRLGFLDGKLGLVLAISIAEGTYYRYLKLWLMNRVEDH